MFDDFTKEDLVAEFNNIVDPRVDRTKKFPIQEIVFLAFVSALCGVFSWRGMEIVGEEKFLILRKYFSYENGIPSHQTLARVFSLLKPKNIEKLLMALSNKLLESRPLNIAIDGKTLRGSYDTESNKPAIHLLNAVAVDSGLSLAQLNVGEKTNEIKVVPQILDQLDVKNAIISLDALNTQKDIAKKIILEKADYTLALKGNHKNLFEEVKFALDTNRHDTHKHSKLVTEKAHGRVTEWHYSLLHIAILALEHSSEWQGLQSIAKVECRTFKNNKESYETRYYLLSYVDITKFITSCRGHWAVENKLHWCLDVIFDEDVSRIRKDHAPANFSAIKKMALNILRSNKGKKSIKATKMKAAMNLEFLETLLTASGFQKNVKQI